jgi:integrase
MPKPTSLTALVARTPFTDSGQTVVRDPTLPGFMVVVGQRARTYTIQVDVKTLAGRKTHKEKIGRYEEMDYKTARNLAMEKMSQLRTGKRKPGQPDPGPTLQEAWDRYRVAHLERKGRAAGTIAQYKDCIERTLKSWLQTPLGELAERPADVAKRHDDITREHGPFQADHTMRSLRAVYRHARNAHRQLPLEHPCVAVDFNNKEGPDDGMDSKQLAKWFEKWATLANDVRREMHLLCLLSASRRRALQEARWADVDIKRRAWHQPKPKGGKAKAFDIPLSRPMLASLARLRRFSRVAFDGSAWLFPSATSGCGHVTEIKEDPELSFKHGHSLRRTFITQAKAAGVSTFLAKVLANHSVGGGVHEMYVSVPALHGALLQAQETMSRHILRSAGKAARELMKVRHRR